MISPNIDFLRGANFFFPEKVSVDQIHVFILLVHTLVVLGDSLSAVFQGLCGARNQTWDSHMQSFSYPNALAHQVISYPELGNLWIMNYYLEL